MIQRLLQLENDRRLAAIRAFFIEDPRGYSIDFFSDSMCKNEYKLP